MTVSTIRLLAVVVFLFVAMLYNPKIIGMGLIFAESGATNDTTTSIVTVTNSDIPVSIEQVKLLCMEALGLQGVNSSETDRECDASGNISSGTIANVKTGIPKGVVKVLADYVKLCKEKPDSCKPKEKLD